MFLHFPPFPRGVSLFCRFPYLPLLFYMHGSQFSEVGYQDAEHFKFLNRSCLFYLLERSVELKPDEGISKYMNLGQITAGPDAVAAFTKGIELIRRELLDRSRRQVRLHSSLMMSDLPPFSPNGIVSDPFPFNFHV